MIGEVYGQIVSDYPNCQKTVSFLVCNYCWPMMKDIMHYYIRHCPTCRHAKIPRDQYNSLLKFLSILICLWIDINSDFVPRLSLSNSYNMILMIID